MRMISCAAALLLAAGAAPAQIGNGSDVTGPGLTNGGLAGGTYEAGGFYRTENAVFRRPNGTALWGSEGVACAVTGLVPSVTTALRDGPRVARPEAGGGVVDDQARLALWAVMRPDAEDAGGPALAEALRGDAPAGSRVGRRARALAESLQGLLGKVVSCPSREDFLVAEAWQDAVFEYERFLDARGGAPATPGLTGVHSVLMAFMEAALAAAGSEPR
jgi:hypothetical protein